MTSGVEMIPRLVLNGLAVLGNFIKLKSGNTRFVQKVSGLTTVHKVDKDYGVLNLIVLNIVPFRSHTFRPTFFPLLETFANSSFGMSNRTTHGIRFFISPLPQAHQTKSGAHRDHCFEYMGVGGGEFRIPG